jgi:lipoate synthase
MRDLRAVDVDIPHARASTCVRRTTTCHSTAITRRRNSASSHVSVARWDSATSKLGPLVRSSYHAWEQVQAAGVAAGTGNGERGTEAA